MNTKSTNWFMVILLWVIGCSAAMQFSKLSFSIGGLASHYDLSNSLTASVLSAIGIMGIFLGAAAGALTATVGARPVLVSALVTGISVSIFQSLLPPFPVLFASRLIEGVSHLLIVVAAPTLMISFSAPKHQSLTMGLWATFFGVAYAITGFMGETIQAYGGIAGLFTAHAGLMALLLLLYTFLGRTAETTNKDAMRHQVQKAICSQFKVYQNLATTIPGLAFFWHTLMFVALLTYLPSLGQGEQGKRVLAIILPVASIAGSFIGGAIDQRSGAAVRQLFLALVTLTTIFLALWTSIGSALFLPIAIGSMLVSGIIQASCFAAIPQLCKTPDQQAEANGAITQLGNLGSTLGPPIFGVGIGMVGQSSIPLFAGVISAFAATMLFFIKPKRPSDHEAVQNGKI